MKLRDPSRTNRQGTERGNPNNNTLIIYVLLVTMNPKSASSEKKRNRRENNNTHKKRNKDLVRLWTPSFCPSARARQCPLNAIPPYFSVVLSSIPPRSSYLHSLIPVSIWSGDPPPPLGLMQLFLQRCNLPHTNQWYNWCGIHPLSLRVSYPKHNPLFYTGAICHQYRELLQPLLLLYAQIVCLQAGTACHQCGDPLLPLSFSLLLSPSFYLHQPMIAPDVTRRLQLCIVMACETCGLCPLFSPLGSIPCYLLFYDR